MAATNPVELIPDFIEHVSDNKEILLIEDIIGLYEEYKAKAAQELEIWQVLHERDLLLFAYTHPLHVSSRFASEMTAQHEQDQAEVDRLAHPNMYEDHEQSLQQIEKNKTQLQQKLATLQADLVALEADCKRQKSAKQTLQETVAQERPNEIG